jgi:hypothetical protein
VKIEVKRNEFTEISTIGDMYIDGEYFCHTIEDTIREVKIMNETAIPYGTYEVVIDFSNKFQKLMPHILNVPNFEGIRIHTGNTDKDTSGCLLIGFTKAKDFVGESKKAFDIFFPKLDEALKTDKCFITITKE